MRSSGGVRRHAGIGGGGSFNSACNFGGIREWNAGKNLAGGGIDDILPIGGLGVGPLAVNEMRDSCCGWRCNSHNSTFQHNLELAPVTRKHWKALRPPLRVVRRLTPSVASCNR